MTPEAKRPNEYRDAESQSAVPVVQRVGYTLMGLTVLVGAICLGTVIARKLAAEVGTPGRLVLGFGILVACAYAVFGVYLMRQGERRRRTRS